MDQIPHKIVGIPCLIQVSRYVKVQPWRGNISNCPSSDDYYGYTECEWEIYDRKGYRARWLDKKIDRYQKDLIEEAIHNYYSRPEEP